MRLFILLSSLLLSWTLPAQSELEVGVFGQHEFPVFNKRDFSAKGVSPGAQVGMVLAYPNKTIHVYFSARWEAFREQSGVVFLSGFGTEEELLHDNLVMGPGLMIRLAKNRKIHPLLGLEISLGIPLRTRYTMVRTEDIPTSFLPEYWQVEGGALFQAGAYFFTGLSGQINEKVYWQCRLGAGHNTQTINWGSRHPVGLDEVLIMGWYASAGIGIMRSF